MILPSLAKAKTLPVLPHEEQRELCAKAKGGDRKARERLILYSMRLIFSLVGAGRGGEVEDSISDALFGLSLAIDQYDPERGANFATYAHHKIRGQLGYGMHGRQTLVTPYAVGRRGRSGADVSLATPIGGEPGGASIQDFLEAPKDDVEERALAKGILARGLTGLHPRDQEILRRRYLQPEKEETFEEIASTLGISSERVRQLEIKALRALRDQLGGTLPVVEIQAALDKAGTRRGRRPSKREQLEEERGPVRKRAPKKYGHQELQVLSRKAEQMAPLSKPQAQNIAVILQERFLSEKRPSYEELAARLRVSVEQARALEAWGFKMLQAQVDSELDLQALSEDLLLTSSKEMPIVPPTKMPKDQSSTAVVVPKELDVKAPSPIVSALGQATKELEALAPLLAEIDELARKRDQIWGRVIELFRVAGLQMPDHPPELGRKNGTVVDEDEKKAARRASVDELLRS